MLESLLGVGLKFNHLRPKRFGGGVSALLRISLLATRFFFSPGTTYPWRAHRTEPGRFEHVQAGLDRGTTAKYPPLWCPSLISPILWTETITFDESFKLSLVFCKRVSCSCICEGKFGKLKLKLCVCVFWGCWFCLVWKMFWKWGFYFEVCGGRFVREEVFLFMGG